MHKNTQTCRLENFLTSGTSSVCLALGIDFKLDGLLDIEIFLWYEELLSVSLS